jgi:hypothetical protein
MDLVDLIESRRFLGGEFLTWLWFRCDGGGGEFDLPEVGGIAVTFDDQMVLEAFLAESEQSRFSGASPSDSPEAKTALRAGKRVAKAKLRLLKDQQEWVFTVSAGDFGFASVKVPAILKEEDERLLERVSLVDDLAVMWRALYAAFLRERLGKQWPAVERQIHDWATSQDE